MRNLLIFIGLFLLGVPLHLYAGQHTNMNYTVTMENPGSHQYHVELVYKGSGNNLLNFRMSAWTPGFYEIQDFSSAVKNFHAYTNDHKTIPWKKLSENIWQLSAPVHRVIRISYDVTATNPFIGSNNLNENYGYIIPGALLLYLDEELKKPVTVHIVPAHGWPRKISTSLNVHPGTPGLYTAANFDVLFDSPFLLGKTETLPPISLKGKQIEFVGFQLGSFDKNAFMANLAKIVASGSAVIDDIPFQHYSFLAVGIPNGGFGGIEHLNSASLLINTNNLFSSEKRTADFYSFLAHEYFHLYNIKRIRPIALGPFDYSRENYSNMLWVSEGITDYYSYLITRRAGLTSSEYVLENYREHIRNYENSPGHLYQTLAQASHGIWAVRGVPQTRTPEELSKTISVYDKGCILGLMLDLKIRHETKNRKSLDDVMRLLYHKYFQIKKRGFTDWEFQQACETIAGIPLKELFQYSNTVKPPNYPKYFAFAGLNIDTMVRLLPGVYMGTVVGFRDSSVIVRSVDYPSSAYKAGVQQGDKILTIDGRKADNSSYNEMLLGKRNGDSLHLAIARGDKILKLEVKLKSHSEKSFKITPVEHPDQLQAAIYKSWLRASK